MDSAIAAAKEKRQKLLAEIALVDQYIKLHEQLFGENGSGTIANEADVVGDGKDLVRAVRRRNNPKKIAERAKKVILEAGHPIQRGDLVRRIEESGLPIHSNDKGKYIGTVLWRNDDVFTNVEGHGYWIKDKDLPLTTLGWKALE